MWNDKNRYFGLLQHDIQMLPQTIRVAPGFTVQVAISNDQVHGGVVYNFKQIFCGFEIIVLSGVPGNILRLL